MEAIFSNPALRARFGPRLDALRARTEAENAWVIGRALLAHGLRREGLARLRHAAAAEPSAKRLALAAGAHLLPALGDPYPPRPSSVLRHLGRNIGTRRR
jgi:hypothetical protein